MDKPADRLFEWTAAHDDWNVVNNAMSRKYFINKTKINIGVNKGRRELGGSKKLSFVSARGLTLAAKVQGCTIFNGRVWPFDIATSKNEFSTWSKKKTLLDLNESPWLRPPRIDAR